MWPFSRTSQVQPALRSASERARRPAAAVAPPALRLHSTGMETLAELQRLRQHLRATISKLMDEAENQPTSVAALAYAEIASECQKLDRAIELLSRDVLGQQPPEGLA